MDKEDDRGREKHKTDRFRVVLLEEEKGEGEERRIRSRRSREVGGLIQNVLRK